MKCLNPPNEHLAQVRVLTKGADQVLASRLQEPPIGENEDPTMTVTREFLENFAKDGLRTLLICQRSMSLDLYEEWLAKYDEVKKL